MNNKKKSGVATNLYKKYTFADHIWAQSSPPQDDLLELAQRCVLVDGHYWIKSSNSGHWNRFDKEAHAIKEAKNKWTGGVLKSGTRIGSELIESFFSGQQIVKTVIGKQVITTREEIGSCPNIQYTMVIPQGPQFVSYNKDTYLNIWQNEMLSGDATHARLGKLMLVLVYRSLCNGEALDPDPVAEQEMLYQQVLTNQYTNDDFRFCLNWLAAIYQNPGINLQTNLWFCGEQNGVGKGTLLDVMRYLLGSSFVGSLNQTEIEAGWNDHLMGKMLIESNEFDTQGKMTGKQWNKWIKSHCNEPTLSIRQRNTTAKTVLNIGNYIFTTNDESPVWLDKTDRRNHLIKTTDDRYWKEFASIVRVQYVDRDPVSVAQGLGWILDQVQVDIKFISSAFVNSLKSQILLDSQNIVEKWIQNDPIITRDRWINAREMYVEFKQWMMDSNPGQSIESETTWGRQMSRAHRMGVQKRRGSTGAQYYVGEAAEAAAIDREAVASTVGRLTGDQVEIIDIDQSAEPETGMKLTPMERLRLKLLRDSQNQAGIV